jgi:hypothetical protein
MAIYRPFSPENDITLAEQVGREPVSSFFSNMLQSLWAKVSESDISDVDYRGALLKIVTCFQLGAERPGLKVCETRLNEIANEAPPPLHVPSPSKFS